MFLRSLLLLWCIIMSSPGMATPKLLVLGDSLCAGYGINIEQGWVALLQNQLRNEDSPWEIINASISGDTTAQGLTRLPPLLEYFKPNAVLIALGANDGLRGLSIEQIKNNLSRIIELSQATKAQVIIAGLRLPPNYGPEYTSAFVQLYPELAKQYQTGLIQNLLKNVDDNADLIQADGLHPNAAAQHIILRTVRTELDRLIIK